MPLLRPLFSEAASDNEPLRDLINEFFSARLVMEPNEPVNILARPLVSEATRDSEPDRDLNNEDLSENPEDKERKPDRDLNSEVLSERLEPESSELLRPLASPLT